MSDNENARQKTFGPSPTQSLETGFLGIPPYGPRSWKAVIRNHQPQEISLFQLVSAIQDTADTQDEVLATLAHMFSSGRARLRSDPEQRFAQPFPQPRPGAL